jgi:tetratricopeptide (TPR) repeat protein
VRLLSPRALLDRLATPLRLLTGGAPGRQGTLRGTIAWSHDLLDADEKRLFRRLTVFSGGGAIDAIEAVCAEPESMRDPLDCAESLVAQSLVRRVDGADGEPRLTLFETIREYGQEQLAAIGEVAETRERHATYYLALAEEAAPHLTAATQSVWLARLEAEGDNLRTALRHWLDAADSAVALRAAGALWRFWYLRGYFGEGQRWLTAALALPCDETIPTIAAARALAFYGASSLTALQRDLAQAEIYGEASLALRRQLGDQAGTADTLHTLAFIARERRDLPRAVTLNEESLVLRRALGDDWAVSVSLVNLGQLARDRGDYRRAFTLTEESLALKRTLGDRQGLAIALNNLAEITGHLLGPAAARPRYEESLALAREVGSRPDEALALENLGAISIMTGEYARAVALLTEAVAHYRALGASGGLASSLTNLGLVRHQLGDTVRATALHEESLTIARAADNPWGTALALTNLSALALSGGDLAGAVARGEEGLALFRAIEDGWDTIGALAGLARAVLAQGDRERAATLWREALTRAETMGAQDSLAPSLEGLAALAADGDPTQAARLCGAAAALRERLGTPL